MTGLVDAVRRRVCEQCLVDECDKNGCSVSLDDAPQPYVVIDLDEPNSLVRQSQTRCDYLFIAEGRDSRDWIVPMEFKNSRMKVSKVVKQLQAGARAAQQLASGTRAIRFRPVAVVREIHRDELNKLREEDSKVSFDRRSKRKRIRVLVCDGFLTEALDDDDE